MVKALLSLAFIFFAFPSQAQELNGSGKYLLDIADGLMNRQCDNCPGYVGEILVARSLIIDEHLKKEDVSLKSCMATLINSSTIWTSASCLPADITLDDCANRIGVYFPKTKKYKAQKVRCKKIVSTAFTQSGLKQVEPDYVMIQLNKNIKRETIDASSDIPVISEPTLKSRNYTVWGVDAAKNSYKKTSCSAINDSILTPLSLQNRGAYSVLTCDSDLLQNSVGAGVYSENKLFAHISFSTDQTIYFDLFGVNEVAVSMAFCAQPKSYERCFSKPKDLVTAFYSHYLLALDFSAKWMGSTIAMLEKQMPNFQFEYYHFPEPQGHFEYTPAFKVKCFYKSLAAGAEVAVAALTDLSTLNIHRVLFTNEGQAIGIPANESIAVQIQTGHIVYSDEKKIIVNLEDNGENHMLIQQCPVTDSAQRSPQ